MLKVVPKWKKIYSVLMIAIALGVESYALFMLLGRLDMASFPLIVAAHGLVCLLIAFLFVQLVPNNLESPLAISLSLFFTFAFFIPILGILGLGLALLPRLYSSQLVKQRLNLTLNNIPPLPDFVPEVSEIANSYSHAPVSPACLLNSADPKKRLDILISTQKLQDRDAVALLRLALRDPKDGIRLLAHTQIDRKKKTINDRIQIQLESTQPADCLFFERIVSEYWELIYSGLVQAELLSDTLKLAFQQVYAGLERFPENAMLHFQLARLLLHTKKLMDAQLEFEKAEQLGIDHQLLVPYFADIAFSSKHFHAVKQHMQEISVPTAHSLLSASASYWQEVYE